MNAKTHARKGANAWNLRHLETLLWGLLLMALVSFSLAPKTALAADRKMFQPQGCEFKAAIARDAHVKAGWQGERLITTAVQQGDASVIRTSCATYQVRDWGAFRAHLPGQLQRAARLAGIEEPHTRIRRTPMGTVASYWGYRGRGKARTFFRSDSYVGDRSFMEVVVLAPPANRFDPEVREARTIVRR